MSNLLKIKNTKLLLSIFVSLFIISFCTESAVCDYQESIQERLRQRIEVASYTNSLDVGGNVIYSSVALPLFYERRFYKPVWSENLKITPYVDELLESLKSANNQGLRASDYHIEKITQIVAQLKTKSKFKNYIDIGLFVDLELVCTDAFLIYGSHLLSGRVNPQTIDAEWYANRREADLAAVLQQAIDEKDISKVLQSLEPPQRGYANLCASLARYRNLEPWEMIPSGPALKPGMSNTRIPFLRKRLEITGDMEREEISDSLFYDDKLKQGVMAFQNRHGLNTDGVVGQSTLLALNIPLEERILQIVANLERWRWLPQNFGKKNILVNIANFHLDINHDDSSIISMRVIVGKTYRRTPVFSDMITYMVLNPIWNVPHSIASKDILALIKANPNYLAENDFELLNGWGADMQIIDPSTVDWSKISTKKFRYRLRQKAGSKNALGRIKFMFPNQFDVYLHDTPSRGLFAKEKRDFSSGCIRVEDPLLLAEYLLDNPLKWNKTTLETQLSSLQEFSIRLQNPVPIHILYWTAWCTNDGTINFRPDIYERDRPLIDALLEESPQNEME